MVVFLTERISWKNKKRGERERKREREEKERKRERKRERERERERGREGGREREREREKERKKKERVRGGGHDKSSTNLEVPTSHDSLGKNCHAATSALHKLWELKLHVLHVKGGMGGGYGGSYSQRGLLSCIAFPPVYLIFFLISISYIFLIAPASSLGILHSVPFMLPLSAALFNPYSAQIRSKCSETPVQSSSTHNTQLIGFAPIAESVELQYRVKLLSISTKPASTIACASRNVMLIAVTVA